MGRVKCFGILVEAWGRGVLKSPRSHDIADIARDRKARTTVELAENTKDTKSPAFDSGLIGQ